ncbi:hypothetical protein DPMN_068545 [Dreissena polymorpha]|uniref:Uncharacterized protein n=1 Tax=Dreissena polymorpha TaxID=45954 RepID=A0A9D4BTP3_DREPO|nr:hypothetical protein DPMN_068545 [Dreissena polymorpha]
MEHAINELKANGGRNATSIKVTIDGCFVVTELKTNQDIGATYIYMSTGRVTVHTDCRRFIPDHKLKEKITTEQNNILLAVYCITECDTTSGFY